ncbi:cytochrome d ubiquinol oxidase subunit II [Sporosarcina sp. FA9]|uniref:cytochrome d ubiquinol oxidase subunit II n=1 Tax=Sporosarcina sp. FA9 TaxID=3413030 RepID=UPI003F65EDF7
MQLSELWFILIAFMFTLFFVLEGFDFGVGTVAKYLGKNDYEKRVYLNTIGPFWDANEVWLISAGAAMFAAFPHWYATLFSGYYIAFVFMLLALIIRGVAFEFRGKVEHPTWRKVWDWAIFLGSSIPPILWGVALTNFMTGVPIDENKEMLGGFLQLLHPFALLGGVMFLLLCIVHGLQFISIRTEGELKERAKKTSRRFAPLALIVLLAFAVVGLLKTDIFTAHGTAWIALPLFAWGALLFSSILNVKNRDGWAFFFTSLTMLLLVASVFIGLFPRVMISTLGAANDLTVYNASSGDYSLKVMSYVSLTIIPFVLAYQGWSYYVFRERLKGKDDLEY